MKGNTMSRLLHALKQVDPRPLELPVDTEANEPQRDAVEPSGDVAEPAPEIEDPVAAMEAMLVAAEYALTTAAAVDMPEEPISDAPVAITPLAALSDLPLFRPELWPAPLAEVAEEPAAAGDVLESGYLELADNLLRHVRADGKASFLVTSPNDQDGKTGLLTPLSTALLQRVGCELLLVDANLHEPDLAASLGVADGQGLADVLFRGAAWEPLVRRTAVERLSVLPGGHLPSGKRFDKLEIAPLLAEWTERFDLVLCDAASLRRPEVAALAACCDGAVLVVRLDQTDRLASRRARRRMEHYGARVLGCVVLEG